MPTYRKPIRDSLKAALADVRSGISMQFAALAPAYGVQFYAINVAPGSVQFFQGFVPPEQADISQLDLDAGVVSLFLYTSDAENQNLQKSHRFSGVITAHIDIYIRLRTGMEQDSTEDLADALEDSALEAVLAYRAWPTGLVFNREYRAPRESVLLLSDGWQVRIPLELTFEVHVV